MAASANLISRLVDLFTGGVPLSNRNNFVDGAMENWMQGAAQPATLGTGVAYVGPVMWYVSAGTGGAGTIGWTDLRASANAAYMDSARNCYTFTQTTASTGTIAARTAPAFFQNIEFASKLAGKTVTVSFKLWCASGTVAIPSLILAQSFGTGGSPSASVIFDKAVNWTVTTTPQKFSVLVSVPNTIGKTYGTNANTDNTSVGFWLPPGVTFTLNIAEAQCETTSAAGSNVLTGTGGDPTTFEYRGPGLELERIQRYYETTSNVYTAASTNYVPGSWAATKRITPAVTGSVSTGTLTSVQATANGFYAVFGGSTPYNTTLTVTGDARP